MLSLRTTLNKGSFTIKRDPHAEKPVEIVSLIFDTVMLGAIRYVDSFKLSAALGDLRLYDGVTKNTQYRQLIGAKEKVTEEEAQKLRRRSNVDPQLLRYSSIQDPFFSVMFEYRPLDGRADNAVALVMRNIDIVYNPHIIREVLDFFRPPETSADSINALIEVAGDTLEDLKNQTRVNLEYALEQHTTLDLRVDMDAPVIVVPEEYVSQECKKQLMTRANPIHFIVVLLLILEEWLSMLVISMWKAILHLRILFRRSNQKSHPITPVRIM